MSWLSFSGRIGRMTWWLGYVLVYFILIIAASAVDVATDNQRVFIFENGAKVEYGVVSSIAMVLLIWPMLAGQVKRWHDRDKSGWWVLIAFIPVIGWIWSIVEVFFLRGTTGPNRFGPDPLMPAGAQWQGGYPQQQPYGAPPQYPPQAYGQPQGGYAAPPQGYAPQQPPPGYGQPQPPPAYGQQAGGYQPPLQPPPPGSGWDQPQPPQQPGWGQPPPPPQGPWGGQR